MVLRERVSALRPHLISDRLITCTFMSDSGQRVGSGELFPTDEPVSGEALIGRADDVDAIANSLLGSINVVLAGPRRLGKTSVARAALEVCRRAGAYTVGV